MSQRNFKDETLAIRQQLSQTIHGEHSTPMYLTSSYAFSSGDEMADAFEYFFLRIILQGVVNLKMNHGGECWSNCQIS